MCCKLHSLCAKLQTGTLSCIIGCIQAKQNMCNKNHLNSSGHTFTTTKLSAALQRITPVKSVSLRREHAGIGSLEENTCPMLWMAESH